MTDDRSYKKIGIFSKNILKTRHIDIFLNHLADDFSYRKNTNECDAFAGWGYKSSSIIPKQICKSKNVPYLALEDGFFRSVGSPSRKPAQLSFICDPVGVYYDTSKASYLDYLMEQDISSDERAKAISLMSFVREHRLTKYNFGLEKLSPELAKLSNAILIVDQVRNDASVSYGGADADDFQLMLKTAFEDYPDRPILIKTHPDKKIFRSVTLKHGYLAKEFIPEQILNSGRVHFLDKHYSAWALFDVVDDVFVITSALGFEALLAGKNVHCFGRPFYGGRGLTLDKKEYDKGRRQVDLETLFFHSCVSYPTYIDPYKQCVCDVETALDILAFLKSRINQSFQRKCVAFGISEWKRPVFEAFLPEVEKPVLYEKNAKTAIAEARKNDAPFFTWSSKVSPDMENECRRQDVPLIRVEDGFVRSRGLGKDLNPPGSLVFDLTGIYYDARHENDLENRLNNSNLSPNDIRRADSVIAEIRSQNITKYNVGNKGYDIPQMGKTVHLVIGQNDSDASIEYGTGAIKTSLALLKTIRAAHPDDYIVYKTHPDLNSDNDIPKQDDGAGEIADMVVSDIAINTLFERIDNVHVLTSLAGFEALIRGKNVNVYGMPFYAGWGLTHDHDDIPRRHKNISLQDLVYHTLIAYPRYVDPVSGLLCPPEIALDRIANGICFPQVERKSFLNISGFLRKAASFF